MNLLANIYFLNLMEVEPYQQTGSPNRFSGATRIFTPNINGEIAPSSTPPFPFPSQGLTRLLYCAGA